MQGAELARGVGDGFYFELHRIEPDVRGPRGRTPRAVGKDEASMHGGDGIFAAEFGDEVVGEIFRREVCDHSGMVADSAVSFTTKDTKITKKNLAGTFPEHGKQQGRHLAMPALRVCVALVREV
jgi:hypothetical protein